MTLFILGEFSSPQRGDGTRMRFARLILPQPNVYIYIFILSFLIRIDIINYINVMSITFSQQILSGGLLWVIKKVI